MSTIYPVLSAGYVIAEAERGKFVPLDDNRFAVLTYIANGGASLEYALPNVSEQLGGVFDSGLYTLVPSPSITTERVDIVNNSGTVVYVSLVSPGNLSGIINSGLPIKPYTMYSINTCLGSVYIGVPADGIMISVLCTGCGTVPLVQNGIGYWQIGSTFVVS